MFPTTLQCFPLFPSLCQCFPLFSSLVQCSPLFSSVYHCLPQCLPQFSSLPHYSPVFTTVPQAPPLSRSVSQYFLLFPLLSSVPQFYQTFSSVPHGPPVFPIVLQCSSRCHNKHLLGRMSWALGLMCQRSQNECHCCMKLLSSNSGAAITYVPHLLSMAAAAEVLGRWLSKLCVSSSCLGAVRLNDHQG